MKKLIPILILLIGIGCGGDSTPKGSLDLMKYGVPIKINAPIDAVVNTTDYGFAKDITVKSGDDYSIQIIAGDAINTDAKAIATKKKDKIEGGEFFSKIVDEDDHGFIFEKNFGNDRINYDFRYVRIQGDKEYVFQAGLVGKYTLDQIKKMYKSVQ